MIKLKLIGALAIGAITVASLSTTTYAMENNYAGFLTNDIYRENIYYSKNSSNINDSKINKSFKIGKSNLGLEDAVRGYGNSWITEGTYFNTEMFDTKLNQAKAKKYIPWTAIGVNDKNGNGYLDEEDVADVKDNLLNKFSANPITEEYLFIYPTTYYKVNTYDKNKLTDELNANLELKEKMDETRTLVNKIRALTEGQKFSKDSSRYQVMVDGETYTISGKNGEAIKLFNEADVITPENVYSYNQIYKGTEVKSDNRIYQFLEFDVMNDNADRVYYDEYNLPYTTNYRINFFNGTELVQGTLYPEASVVYTENLIESLRKTLYDKYNFWYKGMSNYSEKSKAISPEYAEALKTIAEMETNANTNTSNSFEQRQRVMWEDEVASYKKIGYIFTDENAYYVYRANGMSIEEARDLTAYFSPTQSITNGYNDFVNNKDWYEEQARKMGEENFFDTLSSYADSLVDWFKSLFNTATNDKYKDEIES